MVDERNEDDKAFDKILKRGMLSLGTQPAKAAKKPKAFDFVMYWSRGGRKGQRCRVLNTAHGLMTVQFEDGTKLVVDRRAIRRNPQCPANSANDANSEPDASMDAEPGAHR